MHFNFKDRYKDYSNTELLKITNNPESYQEEAVAAAKELLDNRIVSENELNSLHIKTATYKNDIDDFGFEISKKEKITTFFKSLIKPQGGISWYHLAMVLYSVLYIRMLYYNIFFIYNILNCDTCIIDIAFNLTCLQILYPVGVFLIFKDKMKIGWIILMVESVLALSVSIFQWYYLVQEGLMSLPESVGMLWPIALRALIIFYIAKPGVLEMFKVNNQTKWYTILIPATIAFLIQIMLALKEGGIAV
ncbi:hypothetical protein [Polluticaenibacter yanchengensis]|uniref:Uncharacterized protein n=1 Tax=Polluticaenibacter yanchengensis TaxID=3014562 RepID=A0ABT4UMQ6_9BACT|nr:hypothetical protein [Chitinophagaceae bacterium LY-5]